MKRKKTTPSSILLAMGLSVASAALSNGAVIFKETFGTPSGTTAIAAYETANGFDKDSFTYSGTADLRTTSPSSTYTGASGGGNVYFTTSGSRTLVISGISTIGYTDITLSFGANKITNASTIASSLTVQYSTDGTNFTALTVPAQPTGTGTTGWRLITVSGSIPASSSLTLRFTNTGSPDLRIDDISMNGVPETSNVLIGAVCAAGLLRRNRRRS